jgi:putative RNA 2'-phosphotransferase
MATNTKESKRFAKFLSYVLGYRPDEFGLVPDESGYLPTKELLKSINEEKGWRHIRIAHLKEISYVIDPSPIEFHEAMVRARDRTRLPKIEPGIDLPKLLYLAVRRRAYPVILEKGLPCHSGHPRLVLSADEAMAQRIGRRRDQHPILITLHVAASAEQGTYFQKYGEGLFLADAIYPGTFHGPPLPNKESIPAKSNKRSEPEIPKTPGSYYPDLSATAESKQRRNKSEWKKDRRAARRHKARQQKQ